MKKFALIACLIGLGCGARSFPLAVDPIDWRALEARWSVHVVTVDPDGSDRVTRIWIAVVGEAVAIRTNGSRWWANVERDPSIRIRLAGTDYAFRARPVAEFETQVRIDDIFAAKYAGWERLMFPQDRGRTHDHYAWLYRSPHAFEVERAVKSLHQGHSSSKPLIKASRTSVDGPRSERSPSDSP